MITLAWISLAVAFACALIIAVDELRRPQKMAIMNIVWPVTALYGSVFALWAYFSIGIKKSKAAQKQMQMQQHPDGQSRKQGQSKGDKHITLAQAAVAVSHCGAGCTLADIAIEFLVAAAALRLCGLPLWASMVYGLIAAWSLGIVFQYFTIKPMRKLGPGEALVAAIKADTLSIIAFQAGMYGWMALYWFVLAPKPRPDAFDPQYWLSMQLAMILGFLTALPMNWFLLRLGLKEKM